MDDETIYWPYSQTPEEMLKEKDTEIERLREENERLERAIRKAPCSQNSVPCSWPCNNDLMDNGRCWKQIALGTIE